SGVHLVVEFIHELLECGGFPKAQRVVRIGKSRDHSDVRISRMRNQLDRTGDEKVRAEQEYIACVQFGSDFRKFHDHVLASLRVVDSRRAGGLLYWSQKKPSRTPRRPRGR